MLGTLYTEKKQPDEAIAAFTEVLKLDPRAFDAQAKLAEVQLATGQVASALQSAQAASATAPRSAAVRLVLARALGANKDFAGAEAELKKLDAQFAKDPDAQLHIQAAMGSMLLDRIYDAVSRRARPLMADLVGARQAFDKVIALDPNSNEALTGLVRLDALDSKLPAARARLEARLARTPNDPDVLILAAQAYYTAGQLARADSKKAETAGDKAKAAGDMARAAGETARAEQTLLKTLEVAPDTLEAYYLLGQIYVEQKKLDEARKMFVGMAARQPKPVGPKTMIGILLEQQRKRAEARKQYEEVLAIDPRSAIAANNLACIYLDSGENLDMALQLAQTAKAALPNLPQVNDTLGWIFYKKGLFSLAEGPLKLAVERDNNPADPTYQKNPDYPFHFGMALARNGKNAEARAALQAALALKPDFAGADEARKTLASLK